MQHMPGGHTKIEGQVTVGEAPRPLLVPIPEWVQRTPLGIPELIPTGRKSNRCGVEARRAPLVRMAADTLVKINVPYTEQKAREENHQEEGQCNTPGQLFGQGARHLQRNVIYGMPESAHLQAWQTRSRWASPRQ